MPADGAKSWLAGQAEDRAARWLDEVTEGHTVLALLCVVLGLSLAASAVVPIPRPLCISQFECGRTVQPYEVWFDGTIATASGDAACRWTYTRAPGGAGYAVRLSPVPGGPGIGFPGGATALVMEFGPDGSVATHWAA